MTKLAPSEIARTCDLLRSRGQDLDPFAVPPELISRQQYLQSIGRKQGLLSAYETVIPELARRFQTFQPANGDPISDRHIREWLIQFDYDAIPLAIAALQHIRYWDRVALTDAFVTLFENRPEVHSAQWLSLGGPTTSARHLTYLWPDIRKKLDVSSPRMRVLSEAHEIKTDTSLVLYDDNVGSGGQGTTVLQQWCGIPRDRWIVGEDHVDALDEDSLARLKSCDLVFLFATGRRTGLARLIAAARELLGHDRVSGDIVAPDDVNCFRAASRVFTDSTSIARARTAFESAGRIALSDKLEKWGREKVESRILGYGNAGGLTVFYYNVPTTTVTALWKTNGQEWRSLFDRRPRD
jgi:hypothetical protein